MRVREATQLDFDSIYILLKRLNDTSLSKYDWKKITEVNFNADHNHYGYVLEENTEILGFLGTIFSKRKVQGKDLNFCNFHSWIVDPKVKTGGMALLLKVLKLKDCIITNFTASEAPYKIFKSLKFEEVVYKNYKLFPLQFSTSSNLFDVQRVTDDNADKLLEENELKLFMDHREFKNVQFLKVSTNNSSAFVITKRKVYVPKPLHKIPLLQTYLKRNFFLAEIHYISDPDLFFSGFSNTSTALKICQKLGSLGIIVADRYLSHKNILKKKIYPSKRPFMYRHAEDDSLIDTLYSELFILNI